jgi:hypothetical protein
MMLSPATQGSCLAQSVGGGKKEEEYKEKGEEILGEEEWLSEEDGMQDDAVRAMSLRVWSRRRRRRRGTGALNGSHLTHSSLISMLPQRVTLPHLRIRACLLDLWNGCVVARLALHGCSQVASVLQCFIAWLQPGCFHYASLNLLLPFSIFLLVSVCAGSNGV